MEDLSVRQWLVVRDLSGVGSFVISRVFIICLINLKVLAYISYKEHFEVSTEIHG